MAEPWTEDFAALGDQSRSQLRSLAATRATVLSTKETPTMRKLKHHPVLATVFVVALLGMVGGAAYAVVDHLFLSVDPDKSAPEIAHDLQTQLEAQGVPATIQTDQTDDKVVIKIASDDKSFASKLLDPSFLTVTTPGSDAGAVPAVRFDVKCKLDPAQLQLLTDAAIDAVTSVPPSADAATSIKTKLGAHGFHDIDVVITNGAITVTVKSPPT